MNMLTERKKIEAEIAKEEDRYRTFVQYSSEGIWAYDLEPPLPMDLPVEDQLDLLYERAYISEANDALARMLGFEKGEELLGMRLNDFQPRTNPDNVAYVESVVRQKFNITDLETTAYGSDGKIGIMLSNIIGITENGFLNRIWGTSRDITVRKSIEKKLQESQKDLRNLAGKLLTAQENERRILARELHDDLTQRLAALAIDAGRLKMDFACTSDAVEVLDAIQQKLVRISEDVHTISRQLHPSIIEDLGLEDALNSEINQFITREDIPVQFTVNYLPQKINLDISICVYRVVQEALRNTGKYSDAGKVTVVLKGRDKTLYLRIEDDGKGFDPDEVRKKPGIGLSSMRERIRLVGGSISFQSQPGEGCIVKGEIPLPEEGQVL